MFDDALSPMPSPPPQADNSSASAHATQAHHILFMPASLLLSRGHSRELSRFQG